MSRPAVSRGDRGDHPGRRDRRGDRPLSLHPGRDLPPDDRRLRPSHRQERQGGCSGV